MTLLATKPKDSDVCTKVLGHANTGDALTACVAAAVASFPYLWDETYSGVKDRLSNFGMYGSPEGSITPESIEWAFDETDTRAFTVYCNKSRWRFSTLCSYDGFSVAVYDPTNTTLITNGVYYNECVVRVTPLANNTGSENKYVYLYIATAPDTMMVGCTMIGVQNYEDYGTPPVVNISCEDETMTLSTLNSVLDIASTSLWIQFTPDDIDPAPPQTIYITVKNSDGDVICNDSISNCYNNAIRSKWVTLTEPAVEAANYYVYLTTSNL